MIAAPRPHRRLSHAAMSGRTVRTLFVSGALIVAFLAVAAVAQPAPAAPDNGGSLTFFQHFVVAGGAITWFVLIPMSVLMGALAIQQFVTVRRGALLPDTLREQVMEHLERREYRQILDLTQDDTSMLGHVLNIGFHEAPAGLEAMQHTMLEGLEEYAARLLRRAEYLNVIGGVAPMVGLFGTVYGMIVAFQTFQAQVRARGVPDPGELAEGISIALVTTFWGLVVAIPALAVFALTRNRVDAFAAECQLIVQEILDIVRQHESGAPAQADAAAPGRAPAAPAAAPSSSP